MNKVEKWDYIQNEVKSGKSFREITLELKIPSSVIKRIYYSPNPRICENDSITYGYIRVHTVRTRQKVLEYFGCKCKRCGFSDVRALQLDHVNGGGTKEQQTIGTHRIYKNLLERIEAKEVINDYQLLCANCNWIKRSENKEVRMRKL